MCICAKTKHPCSSSGDSQGGHSCIIPARQEDGSSRYQKHLGVPRFSARIVPGIVVFCFFMWLRSRFFLDNSGLIPFINGNDLWLLKFFRFVGWYPPSNHHSCEHQPTKIEIQPPKNGHIIRKWWLVYGDSCGCTLRGSVGYLNLSLAIPSFAGVHHELCTSYLYHSSSIVLSPECIP